MKIDQKNLPNKSGRPKSLKKQLQHLEIAPTNVHLVCKDLLRVFWKLLYLLFRLSSDQWKNTYIFTWK